MHATRKCEISDALVENIQKKTKKYPTLSREQALDQLYLIAYYSNPILYNSPYDTPEFGIRDVAEAVSQELAANPGHFHKIFLFSTLEKKNKVFQLWPEPLTATGQAALLAGQNAE